MPSEASTPPPPRRGRRPRSEKEFTSFAVDETPNMEGDVFSEDDGVSGAGNEDAIPRSGSQTKATQPRSHAKTANFSHALTLYRDATESELRLGFQDYALAVTRVLRDGRGDFCMAILGRWGAGKTRLARRVAEYLQSPTEFKKNIKNSSLFPTSSDDLKYSVVWFSAWQYRRIPEAWIFLYETFSKALVANAAPHLRIARVLRANVALRGDGDLIFRFAALATVLGLLPIIGGLAHFAIPIIGLAGIYQIASLMRRGPKAVKQIAADYATVSSHGEKLGLQATIGKDLRALLRGWIKRPVALPGVSPLGATLPFRPKLILWIFLIAIGGVWALGLKYGSTPSLPEWLKHFAGTESGEDEFPSLRWVVFFAWSALVLLSVTLLYWPKDPINRVLLIVDDLDRCSPSEAIEILDALKLLLDDPDVAERVQALVLADEVPLSVAISEKFKSLLEYRGQDGVALTIREHMEKLFLCSLRLPEISTKEIQDLVAAYTGSRLDEKDGSAPVDATAAPNDSAVLFTPHEQKVLSSQISKVTEKAKLKPTPRQIRSFLAKYQFARALYRQPQGARGDSVEFLAAALARALFSDQGSQETAETDPVSNAVARVIRQVE